MLPSSIVPSMFHRRLLLLGTLLMIASVPPLAQMVHLTVARGEPLRREAESRLIGRRYLPTVRGRILDREGRVLAADRPSFQVAADYRVITGQWALDQAVARARRLHRAEWASLAPEQREALVARYEPELTLRLEQAWDTVARVGGVSREAIERRRHEVIGEVQSLWATVREGRRAERLERELERGRTLAEAEDRIARQKVVIREQRAPHVILDAVDDAAGFELEQLLASEDEGLPGIRLIDGAGRTYPTESMDLDIPRDTFPGPLRSAEPVAIRVDGVGTHVVGWMRSRVHAEDAARRPSIRPDGTEDLGAYQAGDTVGAAGIERSAEDELRGLRGRVVEHLDTGAEDVTPPQPGRDIRLTIDAALQARVQALLSPQAGLTVVQPWHNNATIPVGTPLTGAAVVLEVDTGDILALVSSPTYTRAELRSRGAELAADPLAQPFLNRPVANLYTPGSIVKPLVLCAAETEDALAPGERIPCSGHFYPSQPNKLQCWIWKQFKTTHTQQLGHDPDGPEALMGSCNIVFFHLGERLGPDRLSAWYQKFGVGSGAWDLGIGVEFPGAIGYGSNRTLAGIDAMLMAIGQGPITWTPLHAADAYATIARGGARIRPRLRMDTRSEAVPLGIEARALDEVLEGLRMAVDREQGTTHHVTVPGPDGADRREPIFDDPAITVWGKSGTADAPALRATLPAAEDTPAERVTLRDGDHAWFCGLVAPAGQAPQYAIAVVIDYGGSGGRVAGPIARQVMRALADEGYLPGPGTPGGTPRTEARTRAVTPG